MVKIDAVKINNKEKDILIDDFSLSISFTTTSDTNENELVSSKVNFNDKVYELHDNRNTITIESLKPYDSYKLTLTIEDKHSFIDSKIIEFHTGHLNSEPLSNWITDPKYTLKSHTKSPEVLSFKKDIKINKEVDSVVIYCSAIGIYNLYLNNQKINDSYLLPGFTSYKHQLQYQRFDLTNFIKQNNIIEFLVAGGWAVGSFLMTRRNKISKDKQAINAYILIKYKDGTIEEINTDSSWTVSSSTKYIYADIYDGEGYDETKQIDDASYHNASLTSFKTNLLPHYGNYNRIIKTLHPALISKTNKILFDFKQNFAGFITLKFKTKKITKVIIKHAEILNPDNELNTSFLRTAKQQLIYIAKPGENIYSPSFTYMGFRYITIEYDNELIDLEVIGNVLSSDIKQHGDFECSNKLLNKLNENILWSARSNFIEIPTDCPQRDERFGWTGDIAIFAPTALYNFDATCFLTKWLKDLRSEQLRSGGIPNVIPSHGYGFPITMPKMAIDFWGDASLLVPYALYNANGNIDTLIDSYDSMKNYVDACSKWARLFSIGASRYIWKTPAVFHFGDWVAPDAPKMSIWQKRSVYTATCSLKNTSAILSNVASILEKKEDYKYYSSLSNHVAYAFNKKLTDNKGKTNDEFQTAYVLPIAFDMFNEVQKKNALVNLVNLIKNNNYCIGTGFPGTPYILFTLFDNGYEDVAMKMLLNEKCPSWLYEVKCGATTIWERWDGLDENGNCNIKADGTGGMISYNHYAFGSVGNFLYTRIAGINAIEPGYRRVEIKPYVNKDLFTYVHSKTGTPYGELSFSYHIENKIISIELNIPIGIEVDLNISSVKHFSNGHYKLKIDL